jgi:hypothetical protein
VDTLFWLVFKQSNDVSVMIQPATHIIPARLRAKLAGIERDFQEGHELDDRTAKMAPKTQIGKIPAMKRWLLRQDAVDVLFVVVAAASLAAFAWTLFR